MNSHSFPTDYATLSRTQIGSSRALCRVFDDIRMVSPLESAVLIQGETGTGKELTARAIHEHGSRRNGPFIAINCAAIPMSLLESELFGYEKGAFTGAVRQTSGKFLAAHQGTLFLDEIGDMPLELQPKLLRALEEQQYHPLGGTRIVRMDVRIISASNLDLQKKVEENRFRADLFYRVNVVQLRLPRLRERREDIPCLAEYFRIQHEKEMQKASEPFRSEILEYYKTLNWQGNLRELSNQVARYVLIGAESFAGTYNQPSRPHRSTAITSGQASPPLKHIAKEAVRKIERSVILRALNENQWNRRKTAEALQISYRSLIYKIREAGLGDRSETF